MRRRYDVLLAIADHVDEHGWPPSLDEIGSAVGLRSRSTTSVHLRALEGEGMIVRGPGPRMLRLTLLGRALVDRRREDRSRADER